MARDELLCSFLGVIITPKTWCPPVFKLFASKHTNMFPNSIHQPSFGPLTKTQTPSTVMPRLRVISLPNRRQSFIVLGFFITLTLFLFFLREQTTIIPNRNRSLRRPRYKPTPVWLPPPIKDNFPLLLNAATPKDLPQIPKWNIPHPNAHNTTPMNLPVAPVLLIGFTRTWPLLLQAVTSYITAGWPPSQIYVVENTGVQQSNVRGLLSLQNQFFLNHTALGLLGVNVVTTPTLLNFAQMQNFFLYLAYQHDWPYYFWSHMDVVVYSFEGGEPGITPRYDEPGYKSLYTLALETLHKTREEDKKWGIRFFAYDHLALVNRDMLEDIGGWDGMIPYYITDCDTHNRVDMKGWSTADGRVGIIADVASSLEDLAMLYRVNLEGEVHFVDPNPKKTDVRAERTRVDRREQDKLQVEREKRGFNFVERRDDENWIKWNKLVKTSDRQFQHKHSDRGRNTWQLGQHGGQGEPFYYNAAGLAEAMQIMIDTGLEVYRRKWGHKNCHLIDEAGLGFDDAWRVKKDWILW
ncbi:hypothetical protein QBC38DRAFT_481973 [Podospora fimiseda]|uniref:Uncharacterized protein n=1 Tax=Podospora fimiseda TaxID=252190 RepID=A0AAN7BM67_9PEZI|nr:hypothetical protein QBC38DRAFT_481973 [Podospora fimiseda]